jgi:hypothetical protein
MKVEGWGPLSSTRKLNAWLVAAREQAGERKTDRQRKDQVNRFR